MSGGTRTAVEMARLWTSQNDFHSRLEISQVREIPTFPQAGTFLTQEDEKKTTRSDIKVLPMYPV